MTKHSARTARIRSAVAGSGLTTRTVYSSAGLSRAAWYRRMVKPGLWRVDELERVAAVLGVTLIDVNGGGDR